MTDAREARTEDRKDTGRKKRTPLGARRLKLTAETRQGYVRRFVNDTRGRIQIAKEAGWESVKDASGKADTRQVGTAEDGSPLLAHLMEIKQEFYQEDQASKEADNARVDDSILRSKPLGGADQDAFYAPDEGSSIKVDPPIS